MKPHHRMISRIKKYTSSLFELLIVIVNIFERKHRNTLSQWCDSLSISDEQIPEVAFDWCCLIKTVCGWEIIRTTCFQKTTIIVQIIHPVRLIVNTTHQCRYWCPPRWIYKCLQLCSNCWVSFSTCLFYYLVINFQSLSGSNPESLLYYE